MSDNERHITCQSCGTDLAPGSSFCENCGAAVSPVPAAAPPVLPGAPVVRSSAQSVRSSGQVQAMAKSGHAWRRWGCLVFVLVLLVAGCLALVWFMSKGEGGSSGQIAARIRAMWNSTGSQKNVPGNTAKTETQPEGAGAMPVKGKNGVDGGVGASSATKGLEPPKVAPQPVGIAIDVESAAWSQAAPAYDAEAGRIAFRVKVKTPGTILDTVGLNTAPAGSFTLAVTADGRFTWRVFGPKFRSAIKDASGWHQLVSRPTDLSRWHQIQVRYGPKGTALTVDGVEVSSPEMQFALSGRPVFIGDFPSDAQWEPQYNSKLGFTGKIAGLVFQNQSSP